MKQAVNALLESRLPASAPAVLLALDVQGGDHGPAVTIPAALEALRQAPELGLILVGRPAEMVPWLEGCPEDIRPRIGVEAAKEVISSDARPVAILRRGQDSSLWKALELVADGTAQACVSAGNTVALMTLGAKLLGILDGLKRPALMSWIPVRSGMCGLLDLGANLQVDARQLLQFAIMGSVVSRRADESPPSVGLLNVGHEEGKGHEVVREAHELLRNSPLNYQGFIEGHDLFAGSVDVAVCDGFTGNLILKACEGLAEMLKSEFKAALGSDWRAMAGAALARPALEQMLERLDPDKHNGAPLLGLNGVLVKSHGRAGQLATTHAILEAYKQAQMDIPSRIAKLIRASEPETQT